MIRLAAMAVAAVLLLAACTSDGDGEAAGDVSTTTTTAPPTLDVSTTFSEAATVGSGRLTGSVTAAGFDAADAGAESTLTFTGAFDESVDATRIAADVAPFFDDGVVTGDIAGLPAALVGGAFTEPIELIVIGDDGFVKAGVLDLLTGQPGAWASIDRTQLEEFTAGLGLGFDVTDPNRPLSWLAAGDAGETAELIGEETVDGVAASRWRATIDLTGASGGLAPDDVEGFDATFGSASEVTVDVWVADDDGRLLRYDLPLATGTAFGEGATLDLSVAISDHGAAVGVTSPPADEVVDGSVIFGLLGG